MKRGDYFSYRLNPLMSRIMDVELQDVMIKVWQSLPDDPKSDAEKLVAEKFRTDVGDKLKDVLGLNVAKRLLNIFNRLMLKIQFTPAPSHESLRAFLKKYSFVLFHRINGSTSLFSAQVKNIQDFDKLCTAKDLYCGTSKVVITPLYKFSDQPNKLKLKPTTAVQFFAEKPENDVEKDDKKTPKDVNVTTENKDETQVKPVKVEPDVKLKENTTNTDAKSTPAKPKNQTTQAATPAKPTAAAVKTQVNPAKTNAPVTTSNSTPFKPVTVANKTTPAKPNTTQNTNTQAKPNTPATPASKPNIPAKLNTQVKPTEVKTAQTPIKAKPNTTAPAKPNTPKNQVKPAQTKPVAKAKVTPGKAIQKKSPNVKKRNPLEGKGDFEELDDHDILALMSGGIVLDECSGSDVE